MRKAEQRIRYKYARPYFDDEPEDAESLKTEIQRVLVEELSPEEKEKLSNDLEIERQMIKEAFEDKSPDKEN